MILYETPATEENELYAQLRIYQITKINFNELEYVSLIANAYQYRTMQCIA